MTTAAAAATEPHTALNIERAAGSVIVCTIGGGSAGGRDHTVFLTKLIKIERLIKLKPGPEVKGGQKIRLKIE